MISCVLHYRIDPRKLDAFEDYARRWMALVERFGGAHRGYFLPAEGASDVAIAIFDFESLAAYETYRTASLDDPDCVAAYAHAESTRCIVSHERTFMRPLEPGGVASPAAVADATGGTDVIELDERRDG